MLPLFGKTILVCAFGCTLLSLAEPVSAQRNKKNQPPAAATGAYSKQEIEAEFIEALQEKMLGNTKISLTLFGGFIKKHPNIAAGHYQFGMLSASNGIYSQALPAYQRAVELEPKNKWYLVALAELYDFLKMYKESKDTYKQLSEMYPTELEFAISAVSILEQEGKLPEAIGLLDKIEQQIGVTADINMEKYRLYMSQKKYTEALTELAKLQAQYPNETLYLGMSAEIYHAKGDKKKALETYERILAVDSNNTLIHLAIADFYQKEKNLEKAFSHLEKAFQNPEVPVDKKVMILLSFLDQAKNSEIHRKEGEKLTQLLTVTHPDDAKSWSITGDYALEQKNWRLAMEAFQKSAELDPTKFILLRQAAQLATRIEDYAALKKISETAEELFPMQPEVYLYKGIYLSQTGKFADAEEALGYGSELVIENPLLHSDFMTALGMVAVNKKDMPKANELFQKAIQASPENYWAQAQFARALAHNKELEKAKPYVEKAILLAPDFPEAYIIKAQILMENGDLSGAAQNMEKAMKNGANQIKSALLLYADIVEKNGNSTKAAQLRSEANAI